MAVATGFHRISPPFERRLKKEPKDCVLFFCNTIISRRRPKVNRELESVKNQKSYHKKPKNARFSFDGYHFWKCIAIRKNKLCARFLMHKKYL
jgi:hypothetical protein